MVAKCKKGELGQCKWCDKGECWTAGQVKAPEITKKTQKGSSKGGMAVGNPMAMMQAMMKGLMAAKGKGKGGGGGAATGAGGKNPNCKWCQIGECWGCGRSGGSGPKKEVVEALSVEPATEADIEVFLATYPGVEEHAIEKLKKTHPKLQRVVMEAGDMSDVKSVTAVLMSRIRRANDLKAGDWVCPGCMDLQFAKNEQCRKCQTPKA